MLRFSSRVNASTRKQICSLWKDQRVQQSTQHGGGGKGLNKAVIAIAGGGVTTVVTGVVGYSAWSYENRKIIEDNIPGANFLLEPLLGPLVEPVRPEADDKPKPDSSPLKKKLEREKAKEKENAAKSPPVIKPAATMPPAPPVTPPPQPTAQPKTDQKSTESKEPSSDADLESRLTSSEKVESAENAFFSKRLDENLKEAQNLVTAALVAAEAAARAVRQHAEKAYAAIDSGEGGESLFVAAAEVAKAKKELIRTAEDKMNHAKDQIKKLQSLVCEGRDSSFTKNNSSISAAEEVLSELNYAISKIKSSVAEALRDSTVVSEFRNLVEASKTQFEAEVRSLLPDVKIGEKSDKLSTEELNLLLAHAHRKVLALQKALAKQQTVDKERFKDSVLRQREMETHLLDGKLQSELEKQRRDLGLEHRHRLQQLREDLEVELRGQLKRQAAAHSDHLADMLQLQENQLETKWQNKLDDELQKEADKYYSSLSQIQGDLSGLKIALTLRADADRAAHAAHELWLACESLKMALRLGKENSKSWEEQLLPLKDQVSTIRKSTGEKEIFVEAVLSSLPKEALERGVYTEEALKERFLKVDKVCRRVALVGENGGSLLRYTLSYIQSLFLVGAFDRIPSKELRDEEIDPDSLDTHDILARARYCIAKDDLLQAVRYLNLLRGEARLVASDWLKEAKMSLEARQAADALMAHAAATGARAL